MLKEPVIDIRSVTATQEPDGYTMLIRVYNPTDRTLHAYASPRRIQFDAATKTLSIAFHDQHIAEDSLIGKHLKEPKILVIEGKTEGEIKIRFPQTIKRIRPASETGGEPGVEEIHPETATTVSVEIAHQDTPFYYDPKTNNARQLKQWGNVIARKVLPVEGRDDKKGGKK